MAAAAIRATRGHVRDAASAREWLAASTPALRSLLTGCRLGFYNGAFNPPTLAHAHIALQVAERTDCLWLDPEPATAHKPRFMDESHGARVRMCETMLESHASIGVGCLRRDMGAAGNSAELFHALRALVGPTGHISWAVGADVASGMRHWREKVEQCTRPGVTCDALLVFTREGADDGQVRDALRGLRCTVELVDMPAVPCVTRGLGLAGGPASP